MSEPANTAEIESPAALSDPARAALHDLILCLADSKRILGLRYADWVLGAPELEACIAASSLAQDEWGHSRILYALLEGFGDDPNKIEHERQPAEYRSLEALDRPMESWPEFVVGNAVIDTALTTQIESLTRSRYAPLRQRVLKQLDEERFHFAHGSAWFRRLAEHDSTRGALDRALEAAWPAVSGWFGPDDYGQDLQAEGLCDAAGGALRDRFIERLTPLFEDVGIEAPEAAIDFETWDPSSRRLGRGGPDADTVARARGDRNRAFLMD